MYIIYKKFVVDNNDLVNPVNPELIAFVIREINIELKLIKWKNYYILWWSPYIELCVVCNQFNSQNK